MLTELGLTLLVLLILIYQQNLEKTVQFQAHLFYLLHKRFPTFFCSRTPIQEKIKLT